MTPRSERYPAWLDFLKLSIGDKAKLWKALQVAGFEDPVYTVRVLKSGLFNELRSIYLNVLGQGDYASFVAAYQRGARGELPVSEKAEDSREETGHGEPES